MNLDDLREIQKLDGGSVLDSIEAFPKQCRQIWDEVQTLTIPEKYNEIRNIVVVGMGGSGFAPEMVKAVFAEQIRVPLEVVHNYDLPNYVDSNSLVLLSSYSGTTYEVLNAAKQALEKKANITGLCRGGELADFFKKNKLSGLVFEEKFNPSSQPRLGSGYMFFGILGLLKRYGLLDLKNEKVNEAIDFLDEKRKLWSGSVLLENNPAKKIASFLAGKIPVIVTPVFLEANAHGLRNQLNESAKNFASYQAIPEMNHHLLEGLQFPPTNAESLAFVFVDSTLCSAEIRERFIITKEVVKKNEIEFAQVSLTGETKLSQSLELFSFGSFLSFYLSLLNGVDAQKIPWVDFFKEKLAAHEK